VAKGLSRNIRRSERTATRVSTGFLKAPTKSTG
jgi:hypothetical protein